MKNRRRLAFSGISVSILALPMLASCSGGASTVTADCVPKYGDFDTVISGKLSMSTFDGMPYFGKSGDGQEGIDADFLNEFAADSCLEPEWSISPSAAVIQSVASGRTDIAAGGFYATPERGKIVNLSAPTYVELPTILSKGSPTADVNQLRGKKVGTVSGYTWVDDLKTVAGDVNEFQSTDAALSDLAEGRIDYAVLGSIDAPYLAKTNDRFSGIESNIMTPDPAIQSSVNPMLPNYPHSKGNDALTDALNKAIANAHESGRFAEIVQKYGVDPVIVDVSKYE
ncbi:transporter substrate-binding domain-containing protein [Rothia sp. AR01]|uniref:Transporter substrate-binding domain-containing protein n=1 Tax=Rothia santali TaxID=2949643 RepID=A0A9X2HI18_9MICC|nr:transporter substrate-binding domain-containing protein [Rothia santali]MCP3426947.1 transporter substrate-binding domain-containing protein [Rothia santali]